MRVKLKSKKCHIEIKKGQIQVARFTLAVSDIFCKSHEFKPVDMLVYIAVVENLRLGDLKNVFTGFMSKVRILTVSDNTILSGYNGHVQGYANYTKSTLLRPKKY